MKQKRLSKSGMASLKSNRTEKLLSLPMLLNPHDPKYKVPKDASHHIAATVVTCIDPRFLPYQFRYWTDRYGEGKFELPSHAGGAKQFAEEQEHHYGLQNLAIALEKHHAKEIVLVTHEDCAAYGGSATFAGASSKSWPR